MYGYLITFFSFLLSRSDDWFDSYWKRSGDFPERLYKGRRGQIRTNKKVSQVFYLLWLQSDALRGNLVIQDTTSSFGICWWTAGLLPGPEGVGGRGKAGAGAHWLFLRSYLAPIFKPRLRNTWEEPRSAVTHAFPFLWSLSQVQLLLREGLFWELFPFDLY